MMSLLNHCHDEKRCMQMNIGACRTLTCPPIPLEDFYPLNTQNPQNTPFNICLTSVDKQLLTFRSRYTSSAK